MQSSCRVFWAAAHASRPSCTSLSRHVHSSARNALIYPSSQSLPSTIPSAFGAAQDVHVQKRRRYSLHQGAPAPTSPTDQAKQDTQGPRETESLFYNKEDVQPIRYKKQHSKSQKSEWNGEKDSNVTSLKNSVFKDDLALGRPSKSDKPAKGAAGGKGKKRRLELKDLAVSNKKEPWQLQKRALKEKFGDNGWNPRKKLSPDTMEGIRALHEQDPDRWSTPVLADHFKVSPEAIRRILKSKWRPSEKELEKRRERWANRHDRIWDKLAELGLRPQRTKEKPLEDPDEFEENFKAKEILDNARNA
ncbi:hypothetical protein A1O1_00132 [Capronia coronata CBS 617.96]|uniref:Required for respiratory growth protein 9, mitochondrial n=1 Tax=Capronia coronata CBS 617.96 TaxID=1182541 RepID=W9ZKI3_9EURO|nr:uncharacterized protein A1O1_00132 [Capronia coronata CBS 617.96]EXJ95014.1 hypothetical protein A1O1_00132 [Capronia coronata CBS 617.96]